MSRATIAGRQYRPIPLCRAACPTTDHRHCGGCVRQLGHGQTHRGCEWSGFLKWWPREDSLPSARGKAARENQ